MAGGLRMTDLTDDEVTVLMIAAEGQSMIPLGRWEKPVHSLTAKAYLRKADDVNFYITDAGRQAIKARDKEDDALFAKVLNKTSKLVSAQSTITQDGENLARTLVEMGRASMPLTGDSLESAIRKWAKAVIDRAL